ncbi:hypothetical protein BZY94_03990 [Burkholderia territorii]|nr:hypothetical protein BZY94_03990 [Burkholderia territorii]
MRSRPCRPPGLPASPHRAHHAHHAAGLPCAAAAPFASRRSCAARMRAAPAAAAYPRASGVSLIRERPHSRYTPNTYPQKAASMSHVLSRPPARATASARRRATAPPLAPGLR